MSSFQCVGVDVAKEKFDMAYFSNEKTIDKTFSSDKKGLRDFVKLLKKNTINPWVCMEATGHYSELIAEYLSENSIRVSIVNPLQVKKFASMKLSRNKNDTVDARIIAEYCEKMQPREFTPRSDFQKELKDLVKLLDTLKRQLVQLKNQQESTRGATAKKFTLKTIKELENRIKALEKEISDLTKSNEELDKNVNLITSITGIGNLTAFRILAQLPDISMYSTAKQLAAHAGISPKQRCSGKHQGKTTISRIGDSRLRRAMYMAALSAKRHNEALRPFVERLQKKGKPAKSIICAVMRKLIHLIFGILKSGCPFNPKLV